MASGSRWCDNIIIIITSGVPQKQLEQLSIGDGVVRRALQSGSSTCHTSLAMWCCCTHSNRKQRNDMLFFRIQSTLRICGGIHFSPSPKILNYFQYIKSAGPPVWCCKILSKEQAQASRGCMQKLKRPPKNDQKVCGPRKQLLGVSGWCSSPHLSTSLDTVRRHRRKLLSILWYAFVSVKFTSPSSYAAKLDVQLDSLGVRGRNEVAEVVLFLAGSFGSLSASEENWILMVVLGMFDTLTLEEHSAT